MNKEQIIAHIENELKELKLGCYPSDEPTKNFSQCGRKQDFGEYGLSNITYCNTHRDKIKIVEKILKDITWHDEKDLICSNCSKPKSEHFHRYEKQYDEGLRDNYYCTKTGIRQFKEVLAE